MNKLIKIVKNPLILLSRIWMLCSPLIKSNEIYLKGLYFMRMKMFLNLKNPKTFNEKLQWLKLYGYKPIYTQMVDKYRVRELVVNKIDCFDLLGVYDNFDEIDFDKLPNQFVLKTTHDSGSIVICKDKNKFNVEKTKKILSKALKYNYFWKSRELPYKDVKPRIIAERYMINDDSDDLEDYKFMCFNGRVEYIFLCHNRYGKEGLFVDVYDKKWSKQSFAREHHSSIICSKPKYLDQMITLAEFYSKDIPFLRVDFYELNDKLYFGEFTFFPGGGLEAFQPEEWDKRLGDLIKL